MNTVDKIMKLLKDQNKTQTDLADAIGVKKTIITDWKAGRTQSYMTYIKDIASFFDVSVEYLLIDSEDDDDVLEINTLNSESVNSVKRTAVDLSKFDTTSLELVTTFNELSLKNKARAIAYILELKDEVEEV